MEKIRLFIWRAFIASAAAYVLVAYSTARGAGHGSDLFPHHPLTVPILAIAVVNVAAFRFVPGLLMSERKFRQFVTQAFDPETLARNPRTGQVDQTRLQWLRALSASEQRQLLAANASFVPFIVQLAVAEAVVLYGLVLATISHSWPTVVPFAIVTIALLLTVSPNVDSSLERAARLGP
jgi:hypothetical protein